MIPLRIDYKETPWLRGWEPLMAWLRDHGLDPNLTRSVEVLDEAMTMQAEVYVTDEHGRHVREGTEVRTANVVFRPVAPYPYRTPQHEVVRTWPVP